MKRGKLLGFNGETVLFDSKLRQFSVPIDRVARVVDVTLNNSQLSARKSSKAQAEVRVKLTDGSILVFEPLETKADKLLGDSPIYGEITVPVESIQSLYFGDKMQPFKTAFEEWVVRPAKEPTFSNQR